MPEPHYFGVSIPRGTFQAEDVPVDHPAIPPLAVMVLALLVEGDAHPYEMVSTLRARREDRIVAVSIGSVYRAVEKLAESGYVTPGETTRDGNRPERTTYRITASGHEALRRRVDELLVEPCADRSAFLVGLAESHNVPAHRVAEQLTRRIAGLDDELDELDLAVAAARDSGVHDAYLLTADYLRSTLRTKRDWLSDLADRLSSGSLAWPSDCDPANRPLAGPTPAPPAHPDPTDATLQNHHDPKANR